MLWYSVLVKRSASTFLTLPVKIGAQSARKTDGSKTQRRPEQTGKEAAPAFAGGVRRTASLPGPYCRDRGGIAGRSGAGRIDDAPAGGSPRRRRDEPVLARRQ